VCLHDSPFYVGYFHMLPCFNTTFTFDKQTEDNYINRKFQCPSSFIHFRARFSFGEDRGGSSPRMDLICLTINSNLFPWLHTKTGPSKVGDVVTPPGPWTTLGRFPVGVASRTCLARDIWTPGRQTSWDLSIRRSGFSFRVLRISDLCTLSRHELFAKKTFLPLVLGKALFQSLPKIHDHR